MSWNYMQPNAGLLQYAGAGMNNLGKGLLGMSQQVQEMPYHQKRLGLLDAERNKANYQGLLWRHQAEIAARDAETRRDKNQADINYTNANTAYTNSRTIGQNIENTYKPKSIMADINHKNAQTGYVNANTAGQTIQNQYAPLNNEQALRAKEEAIRAQQFTQKNAEHEHNINQLARMLGYYPSKELRAKVTANPEKGMEYLMEEARSYGGYNFTPNFLEPITEGLLGEEERRKRIENSPFWKGIRGGNQ